MGDISYKLTDKEEVAFRSQGPGGCGVGLGDGAGEELVVREDNEFLALDGVLKLLHGREQGVPDQTLNTRTLHW